MRTIHILHLEDDSDDANLIKTTLKRSNISCDILWVNTKEKYEEELTKKQFDLVLCDYSLPNYNGLAGLHYLQNKKPDIPFILVSDKIGEEKTIELFETGAADFVTKDKLQRLIPSITRALNATEEKKKRVEAEESLKKSEKLFRQFAENIKEVFWQMNPEMDQIIYISPAFDEIWGMPGEYLYKNPYQWMDSIVEEDKEKVRLHVNELRSHKSTSVEYRVVRPDGSIKIIYEKGFPVKDKQENMVSVIAIAADMTEFDQMKAQAHLNDKLTTVGTLAAGVAHEINNPIAWILGNLEFIKKNVATLDRFKLEELVNESIQGAERIRDIVRNLKGFARAEENEITEISLPSVLDSVLTIAASEIKLRAQVETDYASNLPLISGNSGKLHQVFLNLIMNAAQAIPTGHARDNKIRIVITLQDKSSIRVDVIDTGSGIAPENISKIFDPFYTTKPSGNGTGLGLSICYEIIKSIGGDISVKSVLGKGSTFSVTLPLKNMPTPSTKKIPKSVTTSPIKRKQILIVDDEPNLLKSIQRMLEDEHDITLAASGAMAVDLLQKKDRKYDLILSDLSMPNVSGADLYHFIAKKFPELKRRIIFMSGGAYTGDLKKFITNNKPLCIEKPFNKLELQQVLKQALLKK